MVIRLKNLLKINSNRTFFHLISLINFNTGAGWVNLYLNFLT